jgi:hypothetical protein
VTRDQEKAQVWNTEGGEATGLPIQLNPTDGLNFQPETAWSPDGIQIVTGEQDGIKFHQMLPTSGADISLLRTWGEAIGGFRVIGGDALEGRPLTERFTVTHHLRQVAMSSRQGGTSVASLLRRYFGIDNSGPH